MQYNRAVMILPRALRLFAPLCALAAFAAAQTANPFAGNPAAADAGRAVFNARCSSCHGADGQGGRAPGLTSGSFHSGDRDSDVYRTISAGLPDSEMPGWSARIASDDIWRIVAFLRSAHRESQPQTGDPLHGESLFWGKGKCGGCHSIAGRGNLVGPDLSRAGRQRTGKYLREVIANPEYPVLRDYHGVTVLARDGRKITGIEKALDDFSVVLIDFKGNVYSFDRSALRSVSQEKRSLMPSYKDVLSAAEINDLVAYLGTLTAVNQSGANQ